MGEMKICPLPEHVFAPDAQVECVGIRVRAGGIVVGEVTGYEIVDRRLILTVKMYGEIQDEIDNFIGVGFD